MELAGASWSPSPGGVGEHHQGSCPGLGPGRQWEEGRRLRLRGARSWAVVPQGVQPAPPVPGQLEPPLALLPSAHGGCTSPDPSEHLGEGPRPKASGSGSGGSTDSQGLTPASLTSFSSGLPGTNLTSPSLGTVSLSLKNRPSGSPAVAERFFPQPFSAPWRTLLLLWGTLWSHHTVSALWPVFSGMGHGGTPGWPPASSTRTLISKRAGWRAPLRAGCSTSGFGGKKRGCV